MAQFSVLAPEALLDAFRVVATVLADHAEAIDTLELDLEEATAVSAEQLAREPSPVPEGAGSDLAATLEAACENQPAGRDLCSVTLSLAAGSERGATGEAGRALSTLLKALSDVSSNADVIDAERFALGLELAAERLLERFGSPEAGTLSAVVSASATGALSALDQQLELGDVLIAASDDGLSELEEGLVSNPSLAERGAVDSASAGFLLILDSLAAVVTGEPLPEAPKERGETTGATRVARSGSNEFVIRCQVLPLDGCGVEAAAWLESNWHEIGQLVAFNVGAQRWSVQLHTTLPGAAIEALCSVGTPSELHIGLVTASEGATQDQPASGALSHSDESD